MATINYVYAREILDSRGLPTVEVSLWLDNGQFVSSASAGGTSKSKHEAIEVRDGDPNRMAGQGVLNAVNNVNSIIGPQILGKDPTKQQELDNLLISLDGTKQKSKLGTNALIATSQAILKAGAAASNLPLYSYINNVYQLSQTLVIPTCIYTVMNGGAHGADNLDIQEFEIIPASNIDFKNSLNMAVTVFHKIEEVLITKGAIHSTGMVGGFTPNLFTNIDAFEILVETLKTSPYTFAQDVFFGADMAADNLYNNGKYTLKDKQQAYSSNDLAEYYKSLRNAYHVFYLEDPFQSDDMKSWASLTKDLGQTTMIVSDSLTATNLETLNKAIQEQAANTILVKPNQAGTITETINVIKAAHDAGWQVVVSHRSGETVDDFIADFAVGVGANYVKFGPPNRGERVSKYNRLLQIDTELIHYASQLQIQAQAQADQQNQQAQQNQVAEQAQVQGQTQTQQGEQPQVQTQQTEQAQVQAQTTQQQT